MYAFVKRPRSYSRQVNSNVISLSLTLNFVPENLHDLPRRCSRDFTFIRTVLAPHHGESFALYSCTHLMLKNIAEKQLGLLFFWSFFAKPPIMISFFDMTSSGGGRRKLIFVA